MSPAELARAASGAGRLAMLDKNGLDCFDNSVEAFWRSFQAALFLAPAYMLLFLLRPAVGPTEANLVQVVLVQAISYGIGWVAFPLAMIPVCDTMGRFDRYFRFIVAHNWSGIVKMSVFLGAAILSRGLLGPGLGAVLDLMAIVATLIYQWFVTRTALAISRRAAIAIVGLDLAITLSIYVVAGRFV